MRSLLLHLVLAFISNSGLWAAPDKEQPPMGDPEIPQAPYRKLDCFEEHNQGGGHGVRLGCQAFANFHFRQYKASN